MWWKHTVFEPQSPNIWWDYISAIPPLDNPIWDHLAPPRLDNGWTRSTLGSVIDGSSSESANRHDHGSTGQLYLLGSAPLTQIRPSWARSGTPRRAARTHQTPKWNCWWVCRESEESGAARLYFGRSEHAGQPCSGTLPWGTWQRGIKETFMPMPLNRIAGPHRRVCKIRNTT